MCDSAKEIWIPARAFLDEVDLALAKILERQQQTKVSVDMLRRRQGSKFDQEIEIAAARIELTGRGGAKSAGRHLKARAKLFELHAMGGNDWIH